MQERASVHTEALRPRLMKASYPATFRPPHPGQSRLDPRAGRSASSMELVVRCCATRPSKPAPRLSNVLKPDPRHASISVRWKSALDGLTSYYARQSAPRLLLSEGHDRFSSSKLQIAHTIGTCEDAFPCHCSPPQLSELSVVKKWPFRRRRASHVPTEWQRISTRLFNR